MYAVGVPQAESGVALGASDPRNLGKAAEHSDRNIIVTRDFFARTLGMGMDQAAMLNNRREPGTSSCKYSICILSVVSHGGIMIVRPSRGIVACDPALHRGRRQKPVSSRVARGSQ